jgi:hypothetical protein
MSDLLSESERRRQYRERWEAQDVPTSSIWYVRRRLAAAMRLVIERLTTSNAPGEELGRAAKQLEDYATHLAGHPKRDRYESFAESAVTDTEEEGGGGQFDYSPFIGQSNPLSPPVRLWSRGERVFGEVTWGSAYEGPPGCVHGGCIAAAFDEVLGYAETFSGHPGMTGTLTTVYRSPTPLHTKLRFEAWIDRIEGRKIICKGTLHDGERLCAEAEAIFVSLRPGVFVRLIEQRAARGGSAS